MYTEFVEKEQKTITFHKCSAQAFVCIMKIALKTKDAHASQIMSPNTINDLMELENEILKTQENGHLKSSNNSNDKNGFRDQFVCISDNDGIITYSDTDDCKRGENIFNGLPLKLSEEIRRKIGDILDKFKADDSIRSFTVVNGTICLMNRKEINTPVMLKLQIIQEDKEMINSFIWHIKKICLMNVQHNEIKGFQIDDTSNSYMIAKINFILAMTSAGTIVSPPLELISIFFGNPCKISDTIKLEDLIDVPVELASIIKTYARTSRDRRHSVLTLDRMIGEKSRIFHAIYSSDTLTKDNNCKRLSIDVLNPIRNNENKYIFPILIKYKNPDAVTLSDNHTILEDSMPVFFGFELTKKLSESNHSIVYEAFKVLESSSTCGTRIIIKILKAEQEVPAEVKFYKFFCNEPNGCEFIEKPFRIDLTHMPTIFMESSCSQMDLFDFIDKNDILPDSTIKNIFLKIVKAIDYLHGHGIVHFDIKVL